jgi:hypothetical protein
MFIDTLINNRDKGRAEQFLLFAMQIAGFGMLIAVVIHSQSSRLASIKRQQDDLSKLVLQTEETKLKASLSIAKILPTFGFYNIIADLHFINFVQYFGDTDLRDKVGYGAAMEYFDVMLDLDPRFLYGYFYLSGTGSLYAGNPERSVALMNRGLKFLSPAVPDRSYYVWRLKAVDELLFLGNTSEAYKSMSTAANWAKQNSSEESQNVAQISLKTAKYLSRNPNSKQAQFDAWKSVLDTAVSDDIARRAIRGIQSTGGKIIVQPNGKFKVMAPVED